MVKLLYKLVTLVSLSKCGQFLVLDLKKNNQGQPLLTL